MKNEKTSEIFGDKTKLILNLNENKLRISN